MICLTNHDFQGSGEQGSVVMKFTQNIIWLVAPKIAKLVQITPITMVYGTQITIVMGAYKPTNITAGWGPQDS